VIDTDRRADADDAAHLRAALRLLAAGGALTVAVVVPGTREVLHRLDEAWYAEVQRHRTPAMAAASKVLDVAFGTTIDWTVRAAVTAALLRRRRWAALGAWAATIVLGEVSVGPLKAVVNRARPPDPLARTSQTSYPSGHALAAATTAPGLVLALLPPGPARQRWLVVGLGAAGATALSRTYLNAHWLSDSLGGAALGVGYALAAPPLVRAAVRRHRTR